MNRQGRSARKTLFNALTVLCLFLADCSLASGDTIGKSIFAWLNGGVSAFCAQESILARSLTNDDGTSTKIVFESDSQRRDLPILVEGDIKRIEFSPDCRSLAILDYIK